MNVASVLSVLAGAIRLKAGMMNVSFAAQCKPGCELDLILLAACVALFFSGAVVCHSTVFGWDYKASWISVIPLDLAIGRTLAAVY